MSSTSLEQQAPAKSLSKQPSLQNSKPASGTLNSSPSRGGSKSFTRNTTIKNFEYASNPEADLDLQRAFTRSAMQNENKNNKSKFSPSKSGEHDDRKKLENPLDIKNIANSQLQYEEWPGDWVLNRAFGIKVHDPTTYPHYLMKQSILPLDIRNGFSTKEVILPKVLHDTIDPQYIGDFDYPTLDVGTSYACDPCSFAVISSFDKYYGYEPEDCAAYTGTRLEQIFTTSNMKECVSKQPTMVNVFQNRAGDSFEKVTSSASASANVIFDRSSSETKIEDENEEVPPDFSSEENETSN